MQVLAALSSSMGILAHLSLAMVLPASPCGGGAAEPAAFGWEGDSYFEHYRPKIVPRALTESERAEIDALLAKHLTWPYAGKPSEKSFAALDNGGTEISGGDHAILRQLFTLAESGDRDALLAARKALLWGWGAGAPLDGTLGQHVRAALLGHYTAQIWQRYGVEDGPGARLGMRACLHGVPIQYHSIPTSYWARNAYVDCGFNLLYPTTRRNSKDMRKFEHSYDLSRIVVEWLDKPKKVPYQIDRFRQMVGSPEIEKARFDELVVRPRDYLNKSLRWTTGEYAWLQDYAKRHGRMSEIRATESSVAYGDDSVRRMEAENYEKAMVVVRAEEARRAAFKDEIRRAKEEALRNAFTTPLPAAGNVTTRIYDQNGNYLGSERNSQTEAELKGAR